MSISKLCSGAFQIVKKTAKKVIPSSTIKSITRKPKELSDLQEALTKCPKFLEALEDDCPTIFNKKV